MAVIFSRSIMGLWAHNVLGRSILGDDFLVLKGIATSQHEHILGTTRNTHLVAIEGVQTCRHASARNQRTPIQDLELMHPAPLLCLVQRSRSQHVLVSGVLHTRLM